MGHESKLRMRASGSLLTNAFAKTKHGRGEDLYEALGSVLFSTSENFAQSVQIGVHTSPRRPRANEKSSKWGLYISIIPYSSATRLTLLLLRVVPRLSRGDMQDRRPAAHIIISLKVRSS